MDFQERTARERLDHLFTFDLTADPLTQRIIDWRDGDPPIGITPTQEYSALKVYAVALHHGLQFLADEIDRMQIGDG